MHVYIDIVAHMVVDVNIGKQKRYSGTSMFGAHHPDNQSKIILKMVKC